MSNKLADALSTPLTSNYLLKLDVWRKFPEAIHKIKKYKLNTIKPTSS